MPQSQLDVVVSGHVDLPRQSGHRIETIFDLGCVVELAIEKQAASILIAVSSRRQLNDLPEDLAAKVTSSFYLDARDALLKALAV